MTSPPPWSQQPSSTSTPSRRSQPQPSLPPGAMEPAISGPPPPVPNRIPSGAYGSYGSYSSPPSQQSSGGVGVNEFGGGYGGGSGSTSRRPLPQPGLPPNPFPSSTSNGSVGGRRSLPTPPQKPLPSASSQPLPPTRRALPTIPSTSASQSRIPTVSSSYDLPPPAPPPRPDQVNNGYPQTPPAAPPPSLGSGGISRQTSDRLSSEKAYYDSPSSITSTYNSSSSSYIDGTSSVEPSRNTSHSGYPASQSSSSHYAPSSTLPTSTENGTASVSHDPDEGWYSQLDKLDVSEDTGTNITLRPPSREYPRPPSSVGNDSNDGRRTPTANDWAKPPNPGYLNIEARQRTTSTSTIGADDAGLPSTPTFPPQRTLQPQRSFLEGKDDSSHVDFPVPYLSVPENVSNISRHSSASGRSSHNSSDASPSPFPEARQSVPQRQASQTSSINPSIMSRVSAGLSPSWGDQRQTPSNWVEHKLQIHRAQTEEEEFYDYDEESARRPSTFDDEMDGYEDEEEDGAEEVNEIRFFQPAFLSEAALQLRDRVERRRQTKAGIAWVGSFTGKDIVNTIQSFLPAYTRDSPTDRRAALFMARSLQNQLWFVEVDWDIKPLRDSSEDVFRFMGEMEGMGGGDGLTSELPSGLMTMATKCYSPSCTGDSRCYSSRCPFRTSPSSFFLKQGQPETPQPVSKPKGEWAEEVDPYVLRQLDPGERNRQNIIRKAIESEEQYEADLTAMEQMFITGLRQADPPVISPPYRLEVFIREVFCNALELRESCRKLIEYFSIRERESAQRPIIQSVGDIFLQAAADFRTIYPDYTGNLPRAENVLKKELEDNPDFRFFCERIVRENDRRRDIKYLITRPSTQLQRYPAVIEAILNSTGPDDPDRDFLGEALASIQNLSSMSQLKLFHASKGRGPAGKLGWHDLVTQEVRSTMHKKEQQRQMQIWELIQGEMEYVADLETIDNLFVHGLRVAEKGIIIERTRLEIFLDDAFHNYRSLLEIHQFLLENLQARQMEQHPRFGMISDLILDAALNWQDAYMEYVTHYPIAKAKVQEEEHKNPKFAAFLKECLRDPASNRQDIYHFIYRPIPRLLRYNLLLADILKSLKASGAPENHPDIESIPQVMEVLSDLGKATQKGVAVNEAKVELWNFQHALDGGRFGSRSVKDLDLLNPMRELIHRGRVFRQPEGAIGGGWVELTVLLFDNYLVLAKLEKQGRKGREGKEVKYFINRRPIPLELLSVGSFGDAPRSRARNKLLGGGTSTTETDGPADSAQDSRMVWPFTISFIGQGQLGGQYTLWADSYATRTDWQEKLNHAKVLRNEVNDANKVFEMTPISLDTFYMAPNYAAPNKDGESPYTGRVTCSAPFTTVDGRSLIAVGCEEGVWIGLRHDPRSLRKVLHVKSVTNIAVLEEFGIFLVLQDRSLLAYHLEALVPSASSPQVRAAPQRLSPGKDIVFFTVGQLSGRTLVLYMKKKGMDSLFRVLEPILGRNAEENARQRRPFGNLLGQRTEWFRLYKDFFIPTEALGVHFLKHKLAVVCAKGFEIMDLTDLKGGSIPIFDPAKVRDRPGLAEIQRRCEGAKPLGMFRSTETEFLLCYDSFGLYVNRHGEPNRDCQIIEWEGRPDSVAFHPPYLLLCSAPFIEIRHIDNAKLLQIYTGSDIRLTWDGTGGQAHPPIDNPGPNGYGDETSSQEPRIHICQRPDEIRRPGRQGIGQHVFELTPTLALNNPLLNPVHTHDSNYFPPAPMINHRASSVMTTSTGENYFASVSMTPNNANANVGGWTPARSEVSWDSSGRGPNQNSGWN